MRVCLLPLLIFVLFQSFTNERVNKIIALKKSICVGGKEKFGFVVINQKGIDPVSLDLLHKAVPLRSRRHCPFFSLQSSGDHWHSSCETSKYGASVVSVWWICCQFRRRFRSRLSGSAIIIPRHHHNVDRCVRIGFC